MNPTKDVFSGDLTQLGAIDVDSPLISAVAPTCGYYIDCYALAARAAETKGENQQSAVYRFLQSITGFWLSLDTPKQPFAPLWSTPAEGKRSLVPSDLSPVDIEVVKILAKQTTNHALRARLYDILWELRKDHGAGTEAAHSYVVAAEALDVAGHRKFASDHFRRGLQIAARFGKDKQLFREASDTLLNAIRRAAESPVSLHCRSLIGVALMARVGHPAELGSIASRIAEDSKQHGDHHRSRVYWEVEAECWRRAKEPEAEQKARLAAADVAVKEAEACAGGEAPSFMAAASGLVSAIEELRQAGGSSDRIDELRKLLRVWQERSLDELEMFSTKVDISKLVDAARQHVEGIDLQTAILKLAFGQDLSCPKTIREQVRKNSEQAPLTFLIGAALLDQHGRTIFHKEGFLNLQGEALEAALDVESFSHASRFDWALRVEGFIEPARVQIYNEHHPSFEDLAFIVRNNPFIPRGHEGIFLRGLHAGFHGDFLVASHLLTPQIENSLRYVLENNGVDVSNLHSDGTQPVKVLGAILGMSETIEIFGEQLCFELRGCLNEKAGFDFRNRVAHGFVDECECYSPAGVTVWWLILRICLGPAWGLLFDNQRAAPADNSEQPLTYQDYPAQNP